MFIPTILIENLLWFCARCWSCSDGNDHRSPCYEEAHILRDKGETGRGRVQAVAATVLTAEKQMSCWDEGERPWLLTQEDLSEVTSKRKLSMLQWSCYRGHCIPVQKSYVCKRVGKNSRQRNWKNSAATASGTVQRLNSKMIWKPF